MTFPFGPLVTLVKRVKTGTDSYGDPVYTDDTSVVVRGAFDPHASTEANDQAITQPVVYLPPDTDVSWLDAVVVNGQTYEVDGSPNNWIHPMTGWHAGVEVRLKSALRPPA